MNGHKLCSPVLSFKFACHSERSEETTPRRLSPAILYYEVSIDLLAGYDHILVCHSERSEEPGCLKPDYLFTIWFLPQKPQSSTIVLALIASGKRPRVPKPKIR